MVKFGELFEKSIITTSVLSLMLVGAAIYMTVTNQPIPDWLTISTSTVLGFFIGAKTNQPIISKG